MDHIITTYGGGELFSLVFNGIAALFKQDSTGMVMPLIRVGLMVGLVYTIILMFFRSSLIEGFYWIFWVVIATNILFLPKTTVFIHDPLTKEKFKVDNVPLTLGVFASFVSHAGKTITEKVESVFSLPDYMPYHETGTVFASSLMRQLGQFRIIDAIFKGNMERFVNQCVVYDVMIGHKYTLFDLQSTPDIWKLVSTQASPVLGFMYREGKTPGTVVTCKAGAQKLNALWTTEIKRATAIYGSRVQNRTLTESAFNTGILGSARLLTGSATIANSAMDLLRQEMIIQAIEESSNNKLSELGSSSNYASTKALLQQRSTYAIAGDIAARTLPLFKNVVEVFSYALFIFIVVLALLPNGYRIISTYFGILLWTQLWAPLYAVLNLIMTLYGRSETASLIGSNGLTLLNSSAIINANADMVTLAAWLAMSIPFISYGILKQGASAFVGLAHHLGSAMQASASGVASEAVSGNISLGNVSLGTQAYQNTSAFQHHTSPSYNTSQFKGVSVTGVEQSSFASGNQSFTDHSLSRLRTQVMGTENTSFAMQESLNQATSFLQSKSIAAGNAAESSFNDSVNFMSHIAQTFSADEGVTKNISASDAKTLQDFTNRAKAIQQREGLSEQQAFEAALRVEAGTPKVLGASIQGSAGVSTQGARHKGTDATGEVGQNKSYAENMERIVSAGRNYAETTHDLKGLDLGHTAAASLNQAKSLREEVTLAQNQVETLSKDLSSSQSKSFFVNKDLTQNVLDYIAHQPVNNGPQGGGGKIGYEGARKIIEMGGEERESYLRRFQEENPQYAIQEFHSGGVSQAMSHSYDRESQNLRAGGEVSSQNLHDRQNVIKGAEANPGFMEKVQGKHNVHVNPHDDIQHAVYRTGTNDKVSAQEKTPLQTDVDSLLQETGSSLEQRQGDLSKDIKEFQVKEQESKDKNMTLSALKGGVNSLNPVSDSRTPSVFKEENLSGKIKQ